MRVFVPNRALHRLRSQLHWVLGGLGLVAACAGVAVLFTTDEEARSAFLLAVGVALLVVAWFGGRIELEGFELFGAKARVRDVVKTRLEVARTSGAGQRADDAARQAAVLQQLAGLYEHVRRTEPPGPSRTAMLEDLVAHTVSAGEQATFEPAEVRDWLRNGSDSMRVIALVLMLANEAYRDILAVLETIEAPRSLFEQYYGLRLAHAMAPTLDPLHKRLLTRAIERARRKRRFKRDNDVMYLSRELLDRLGQDSAG